ncbi:hypothetical protein D3C80_1101780 [compost metagenome]
MHANDGDTHDDCGTTAYQAHMGRLPAQFEGNSQRRGRGADGNHQRSRQVAPVVVDARLHLHGRHAGVVHGSDARAHDQRAKGQLPGRQARLVDQPQGEAGRQYANEQRQQRDGQVITQFDRQTEGEHADEVHRPDSHAHGQGTARRPQVYSPALGRGDTPGQVQCGVRSKNGYAEGNQYQRGGILTDEHGAFRGPGY